MMTLARTMWQAMITYKDYPVNWLICVTRHQCVNFSWEKIHVYSDENSIEFIMCFWYKATWFHRPPVPCIFYQQHVAKFIAWTLNKIKLALFYRKLLSHHDEPFGCGTPSLTGMVNHNIWVNISNAYDLAKCFDLVIQASWFKHRCNIIYTAKEMPAFKNRVRVVDSDIITSFVRIWPMSRIIYKCLSNRSIVWTGGDYRNHIKSECFRNADGLW